MAAYEGYVNIRYEPHKDDLVCRFYMEPKYGIPFEEAASAVAAESSVGTWTDISTAKAYVKKYAATVFSMDVHNGIVDIAYPLNAFEPRNVPQLLSSIAGNIFGMKEVSNLRLYDIKIPKKMLEQYDGPLYGIAGVRKLLKVKDRPLVGTIVKPKMGLNVKDHAQVAYEAWLGGCDIVKDDENLTSQKFCPFQKRFLQTIKMRDKAEKKTGERKVYMVNITAPAGEMLKRAKFVKQHGGEYIMVDILTVGFSALEELRDYNDKLQLVVHEHRAMHAAFTRNPKHGIAMLPIAKLTRMIGFDQLHAGSIVGKMEGGAEEVIEIVEALEKKTTPERGLALGQEWHHIKPTFAVASGGLYPGHVPAIVSKLGKDVIIQMGGGIHGHPKGTIAGAKAARAAVDAVAEGISLHDSKSPELKEALAHWGNVKF
jgi:ribulose-bisphosphate carboxylase large chain